MAPQNRITLPVHGHLSCVRLRVRIGLSAGCRLLLHGSLGRARLPRCFLKTCHTLPARLFGAVLRRLRDSARV
jgi:hypothetical protein